LSEPGFAGWEDGHDSGAWRRNWNQSDLIIKEITVQAPYKEA
jgi:hypothetical protein